MNWIKGLRFLNKFPKPTGEIFKCGVSQYSCVNKNRKGICDTENFLAFSLQQLGGCVPATSFQQTNLGSRHRDPQQTLMLARNMLGTFELSSCIEGGIFRSKGHEVVVRRWYGQRLKNDPELSREFLAQLWVHDKKMKRSRARRRQKVGRWFSGTSPVLEQPPLSQSATGVLAPASPEEARVAPLLARSNLLITRDIEWANLVFGFEQENRYAIVDVCYPESPVGFIREQSNVIARQLLRSRRPFVACITDAMGSELFKVRRPFWWITSSIYAEIDGKEVGVVHRRWHLWKRIYDLYLGNKQFAVVENPGFWNWTFTLKDIDGQVLAQIDRDWRGFGFEIFTDAGQYVIRFGRADNSANIGPDGVVEELEVIRPLTLAERAVAVALAVSLDNDYFSRHGGWGLPFVEVGEFSDCFDDASSYPSAEG